MKWIGSLLFVLCAAFVVFGTTAEAFDNECLQYRTVSTPPEGYGSPMDLFNNPVSLMLGGSCEQDSLLIIAGYPENPTYDVLIYRYSYVWRNGAWQKVTLSGSGRNGDWLIGGASKKVGMRVEELHNGIYYVAYACRAVGDAWKCGCRDETCSQGYWQLQHAKPTIKVSDVDVAQAQEKPENVIAQNTFTSSNDARATEAQLDALTWDSALADVARKHSEDMARRNFFSHTNPDRCDFACRAGNDAYQFSSLRENLYMVTSPHGIDETTVGQDSVVWWLDSPGHRANLLADDITHTGVGVSIVGNVSYVTSLYSTPR
jgi:uncharacterized protein YkwD